MTRLGHNVIACYQQYDVVKQHYKLHAFGLLIEISASIIEFILGDPELEREFRPKDSILSHDIVNIML